MHSQLTYVTHTHTHGVSVLSDIVSNKRSAIPSHNRDQYRRD